ncbi:Ger(x)C family spore germination protein [Paenibacillus sp. BR2-3]|uniref:Ger(x)C family spore germination protein n=1 Tax=Paenibacillus sp. BR2-3 TaxID=3048494 RepID=UPI0039772F30
MKKAKSVLSAMLSLLLLLSISGCWNYSEVEEMSIVAGVAIDKNESDGKLLLTVEMVDIKGGLSGGKTRSKLISLSGKTMFDIVRNMITLTGDKLFWSHAKTIIISEEIAREGLVKVIDWYSRDTETRSDVYIFISKEKKARDILNLSSTKETIMSFEIAQMMRDEEYVSTAPVVEIWDFIDKLESQGQDATAPLVFIHEKDQQKSEIVRGTAIFSKDKMIGTLNGEDSKYMMFVRNKVKGGILVVEDESGHPAYSLEILSNRTKVKPMWVNGKLQVQIKTETNTWLDEVMNANEFPDMKSKKDIEKLAEQQMQKNIIAVIHKVQQKYQADIFGFGAAIHRSMPKAWDKLKKDWNQNFAELDVVVQSKVIIESTAKTSRSIRIGD